MRLALRCAVEEEVRRRPVAEKGLQIGRRVQRGVLVAGQGEGDVDGLVEIIRSAERVPVIPRAAARQFPIRIRAIVHNGVDVGVDRAGDDPFVRREAARYDVGVQREEQGVGLSGDGG